MNIIEKLTEMLLELEIFEMAFEKKVAIQKARNLQDQIAKHLIKILMYSESEYVGHWAAEANSWLDDIQDNLIKGKNKPLPFDVLLDILWNEPMGTIHDIQTRMNRLHRDNNAMRIDQPDAYIIHRDIEWLMTQICMDISNNNFNGMSHYLDKLKNF